MIYRADIDGLRTVAVLSVILFHVDYSWVPGGYTGVDIFFVISGFLITRIIAREIEGETFSLRKFYIRRIRRILPVFYTVTAVSMIAGAVLLLPEDLQALLDSVRHAIFFAANIYFSKDKGYFDISSDEKPMLHIWSLSIEEQYYFVWPLLLVFFYTLGYKIFRQPKRTSQFTTLVFTALLIIAGFGYAQYELVSNPGTSALYFSIQMRFGELMIGSITALIPQKNSKWSSRILAYAGTILIVLGFVTLNKDSLFPGLNALFPCLGTAFLIYAGQNLTYPSWPQRVLGMRYMAAFGLLSYSLYLWHWPVLAYMRYVYGSYTLPWLWIVQALALIFVLSFLSYRYVEKNTKTATLNFKMAFLGVFLIPALFILATTYGLQKLRPVVEPTAELSNYGSDVCHGRFDRNCARGDKTKKPTVLVVGDSHAAMLNSFIDVVGKHEGWSAEVLTSSSCSPVFTLDETVLPRWAHKPCSELKQFLKENYAKYDAVLLASFWPFQLDMLDMRADSGYLGKLELTLREISQEVPVYVLSDVPQLPIHPFRQLYFSSLGLQIERAVNDESARANEIVEGLVDRIPNVHWVDLTPTLSKFDEMSAHADKPTYFDENHLNVYGATVLGELFVRANQRILAQ